MFGGTEAFRLYGTVGVDPKPAMAGLDQLSGHVQRSGGIIQGAMGTALGFLGGAYMQQALNAGVGMLKGVAIDYNASMEQASIGFTTLLGSAEKAQAFIEDLQSFAKTTPFDFPGLQSAANQMLAMGFSSDEIVPKLTAVGDAVAALGGTPDMVNRAVYALGQMKSAGRVTAQDMMQLTSMGIPAWKLLADSMGVTVQEARKLSEKGLIPAEQAIEAITSGIEKSNMGGMMAQQSKTFTGAMSNITDTLTQALGKAFTPFFEQVSMGAQALATWMGSAEGERFFEGLSGAIGGVIEVLKGFIPVIQAAFGFVVTVMPAVIGAFQGLWTALQPVIEAAAQVLAAIQGVVQALMGTGEFTIVESFENLGSSIMGYVETWLATIPSLLASLAGEFVAWVGPIIPPLLKALGDLAMAALAWVGQQVPVLAAQLLKWAGAFVDWIGPQVPVFLGELLDFVDAAVGWIASTGIPKLVDALLGFAKALVAWVGPQVPVLLGKVADLMVKLVGWIITTGVPRLLGAALKLGGALVQGVVDLITGRGGQPGLVSSFGTFVTRDLVPGILAMGGTLLRAAVQLGGELVRGIVDGMAGLPGKIWSAVTAAFRSLRIDVGPFHISSAGVTIDLPSIDLPQFAHGSWDVPGTGAAVVHQGEMILPADVANRLRRFGGIVGGGASPQALQPAGAPVYLSVTYAPQSLLSTASAADIEAASVVLGDLAEQALARRGRLSFTPGLD